MSNKITYPPELLPSPDPEDEVQVIVCARDGCPKDAEIERLRAALQKCVAWIQDECRPEADFVAQGHNWNMSRDDRKRGKLLLSEARRVLDGEKK